MIQTISWGSGLYSFHLYSYLMKTVIVSVRVNHKCSFLLWISSITSLKMHSLAGKGVNTTIKLTLQKSSIFKGTWLGKLCRRDGDLLLTEEKKLKLQHFAHMRAQTQGKFCFQGAEPGNTFPLFSREADGVLITKEKKLVCSIGARAQALMWSQKWGVKEIQGEAHQRLLNCCQFWLKGIQHEEERVKRSH